jgi:hypothetical protein
MSTDLPNSAIQSMIQAAEQAVTTIVHNMNSVRKAHNITTDTLGINTTLGVSRARNIFEEGRVLRPLTYAELHCLTDVINMICNTDYSLHDYETASFINGKIV